MIRLIYLTPILLPLLALLFLSGCVSSVAYKVPSKQHEALYIDPNVTVTETITYRGYWDSVMEMNFGTVVGYQAVNNERLSASQAIALSMEKNNIQIDDILVDAIATEFDKTALFGTIKKEAGGYPKMAIEIEFYGLMLNLGIADARLKPYMDVTATLVDEKGEILWRKRDYVSNASSETTPLAAEEYFNDPENLRRGFEKASQLIAKGLAEDMSGK